MTNQQLKLVHIAARAVGLRGPAGNGRYWMLLGQYTQSNGRRVTSSKQLTSVQFESLMGIMEAQGFEQPGKTSRYWREKASASAERFGRGQCSFAQLAAVYHLAGDLGWAAEHIDAFCRRMTQGRAETAVSLSAREAYTVIEGMAAMVERTRGRRCRPLGEGEYAKQG